MSNVSGQISVNLSVSDSTTLPTKSVFKSIVLDDESEFTSGVVAIASGTVGAASVSISLATLNYRNAAGEVVEFNDLDLQPALVAIKNNSTAGLIILQYPSEVPAIIIRSGPGRVSLSSAVGIDPTLTGRLDAFFADVSYTVLVLREA